MWKDEEKRMRTSVEREGGGGRGGGAERLTEVKEGRESEILNKGEI